MVGADTDTTVTIIDGDQNLTSSSSVTSSSVNTIQNSFSHLEISSYVRYLSSCVLRSQLSLDLIRPPLDTIDFFNDTLDIRKDAIQPYKNYNDEDLDGISVDLGCPKDDVLQVSVSIHTHIHNHKNINR